MSYYSYYSEEDQAVFEVAKSEYRRELIELYQKTLLQVPVLPLKSDSPICNIDEIYVKPTITRQGKRRFFRDKPDDIEVKSMSEIFKTKKDPPRSIYVVGDAGTGKSLFCKTMIRYWCMAHSGEEYVEDEFDGIKEMKKYEFMFHISLKHYRQIVKIKDMLINEYREDIVTRLLDKECKKVIILLDGLDEFYPQQRTYNQFQTEGLPETGFAKDYTVLTTSRPWKIFTMRIRDNEMKVVLNLKRFNKNHEKDMIYRTVSALSTSSDPVKDIEACRQKLDLEYLTGLKRNPLMLQHLICLWFNGKLDDAPKCVIYSSILELFFQWHDSKSLPSFDQPMEEVKTIDLPQHLSHDMIYPMDNKLIHDLSKLAFKTLLINPKDQSLVFHLTMFDEIGSKSKVKKNCVKLGVLSEDVCPDLSISSPRKSDFTFIHKSVQEFLAAVNIAINFKEKLNLSDDLENTDSHNLCIQFVNEVFQNRSTLDGVLEQSGVIILLCGIEPRLATLVMKYIYNITLEDPVVRNYRRTVQSDDQHVCSIQELVFKSLEEWNINLVEGCPLFDIGDLVVNDGNIDTICSSIDAQQIAPNFVRSLTASIDDIITTQDGKFLKYLPMFKHLEKITIVSGLVTGHYCTPSSSDNGQLNEEIVISLTKMIEGNISTLKSLSISGKPFTSVLYPVFKIVLCCLPAMNNLVAVKMRQLALKHRDVTALCEFLKESDHLEGVDIRVDCECGNNHDVDLSRHQQLRYINISNDVCVTHVDTTNLEEFVYSGLKFINYTDIFGIVGRADKLTELDLHADFTKAGLFHSNVTTEFVRLLPTLQNLRSIRLTQFRLHENIIQSPAEMKNLKHISFSCVVMNLRTWCKFADSLPDLPLPILVQTDYLRIAGNKKETSLDVKFSAVRSGKRNDAEKYIRDQNNIFIVVRDDSTWLSFMTRQEKKE